MKFTRIFILRAINIRNEVRNNQNPLFVLKELIISHPFIDLTLALILSILVMISNYNDDSNYIYTNSLNIYLITKINVVALMYHFCLEYIDTLSNIKINFQKNNLIQPNLNENNNENFEDNTNLHLHFNKLKIYVLSFLKLSNDENYKLPSIIYDNYHLFKSFLHLLKIIVSCLTYFLSLTFCFIFTNHKNKLERDKYYLLHLLILDFYEFYSGFRVCYFLIKILINIYLLPVYISSIILGFVEDKFNIKLNKIINTKYYSGRSSVISQGKGRASEMEEYCSICLNSFQLDDVISTLPCSRRHTFHTLCLEKWFITTVSCPLCRSDFQNSIDLHINSDSIRDRPFEMQQNLL